MKKLLFAFFLIFLFSTFCFAIPGSPPTLIYNPTTGNYEPAISGAGLSGFSSIETSYDNTKTVAISGGDYTSLATAVTAANAGDTIKVYPGTYTESITIAVNNLSIISQGSPFNTILTQADANIIDFGTTIGGRIQGFTINLSAATTAIAAITGTSGNFTVKTCRSMLGSSAALNQASQPRIGKITGAGSLMFRLGKTIYNHTGACTTASAVKAPFEVATGGKIIVYNQSSIDIDGAGSSLITALGLSTGTGHIIVDYCIIDVDDDTSVSTVGLGYLASGTSVDNEFSYNQIHVHAAANDAYGAIGISATIRSSHNHFHVECSGGGTAYSFADGGGTINSHMDDIIATGGYTGNVNMNSSDADGDGNITGDLAVGGSVSATGSSTSAPAIVTSFTGTVTAGTRTATFSATADYALCKVGSRLKASDDDRIIIALTNNTTKEVTVDADTTWGATETIQELQEPISQAKAADGTVVGYKNPLGG